MNVVADASAVASFLIPDEADAFSDFARTCCTTETVHVPAHWPVELANILWKAYRQKRILPEDRAEIVQVATAFHRTVTVQSDLDIAKAVDTATQSGLTAYDTAYLLLAERLKASLLTRDVALARMASKAGISVLAP